MNLNNFFKQSRNLFLNESDAFKNIKNNLKLHSGIFTYFIIFFLFSFIALYYSYYITSNYIFFKKYLYAIGGYFLLLFTLSFFLTLFSNISRSKLNFGICFKFILSINLIPTSYLLLSLPIYIQTGLYPTLFFIIIFIVFMSFWIFILQVITIRNLTKCRGGKSYLIVLFSNLFVLILIGVLIYYFVDYSTLIKDFISKVSK
jgi:hypothetical protein